jgi:polysaccharide biosynthesis protein PslH
MARKSHDVTVLTLWSNDPDRNDILHLENEGIKVIAYKLGKLRSMLNVMGGGLLGEPLQSYFCWQPQLARKLADLVLFPKDGEPFKIVHIEHLRGARFGQYLRSNQNLQISQGTKNTPIIWDSVDSISHLFQQAAQSRDGIFSRMLTRFELPRTRKYEPKMVQLFDRTLVTSQIDKEEFEYLLPPMLNKIKVLPNGVDLNYFQPDSNQKREANTLVVSGKMSYHANISMVLHLIQNIMPIVWMNKPAVKL